MVILILVTTSSMPSLLELRNFKKRYSEIFIKFHYTNKYHIWAIFMRDLPSHMVKVKGAAIILYKLIVAMTLV